MNQDLSNLNAYVNVAQSQKKNGHHFYPITGKDKKGEFTTLKRYSQFDQLKHILTAKWPGCYVPSLPQKKFLGTEDSIFIEIRRQGIHSFLNTLKDIQHLWYSQDVQIFLRKVSDEKQPTKSKQNNLAQILNRYKQQFPQCFNKEISKDMNNQIIEFNQYLKKATGLLQNLQKMADQMFNSRKKFNQKYSNMIQTLIPGYQKNFMEEYMKQIDFNQLIFNGSKKQQVQENVNKLKEKKPNSFLYILQQIKRQKFEVHGFEQVLKVKENYSIQKQKAISKVKDLQIQGSKIQGGKQSFFSKIKNKSKQDQLKQNNQSIKKAQQEQKNLTLLCEIVTSLLGLYEIKRFKGFRQNAYYRLLKRFFLLERQESRIKKQLWIGLTKINQQKQEEVINFFEQQQSHTLEIQNNKTLKQQQEKQVLVQEQKIKQVYQQKNAYIQEQKQIIQKEQLQEQKHFAQEEQIHKIEEENHHLEELNHNLEEQKFFQQQIEATHKQLSIEKQQTTNQPSESIQHDEQKQKNFTENKQQQHVQQIKENQHISEDVTANTHQEEVRKQLQTQQTQQDNEDEYEKMYKKEHEKEDEDQVQEEQPNQDKQQQNEDNNQQIQKVQNQKNQALQIPNIEHKQQLNQVKLEKQEKILQNQNENQNYVIQE